MNNNSEKKFLINNNLNDFLKNNKKALYIEVKGDIQEYYVLAFITDFLKTNQYFNVLNRKDLIKGFTHTF